MTFRSIISILLIALSLCSSAYSFAPASCVTKGVSFGRSLPVIPMSDDSTTNEEIETPPAPVVRCPDCDQCDGSGRILGGIPLLLPWWPIKPYRPCPNFIANGGRYTRIGQPLDEIAFGRGNIDIEDDDF